MGIQLLQFLGFGGRADKGCVGRVDDNEVFTAKTGDEVRWVRRNGQGVSALNKDRLGLGFGAIGEHGGIAVSIMRRNGAIGGGREGGFYAEGDEGIGMGFHRSEGGAQIFAEAFDWLDDMIGGEKGDDGIRMFLAHQGAGKGDGRQGIPAFRLADIAADARDFFLYYRPSAARAG